MTKFNQCPNCGRKIAGLMVSSVNIYECRECGTCYCSGNQCGGSAKRCPDCGSKSRKKAGRT